LKLALLKTSRFDKDENNYYLRFAQRGESIYSLRAYIIITDQNISENLNQKPNYFYNADLNLVTSEINSVFLRIDGYEHILSYQELHMPLKELFVVLKSTYSLEDYVMKSGEILKSLETFEIMDNFVDGCNLLNTEKFSRSTVTSPERVLGKAFLEESSYSPYLSLFKRTYQQFTSFPLRFVNFEDFQSYIKEVIAAIVTILGLHPVNVNVDIIGASATNWGVMFANKIHDLIIGLPKLLSNSYPWLTWDVSKNAEDKTQDVTTMRNMIISHGNKLLPLSQILLLLLSSTALSVISNARVVECTDIQKSVGPFLYHSHYQDEIPHIGID
jgi:hypothetical protein